MRSPGFYYYRLLFSVFSLFALGVTSWYYGWPGGYAVAAMLGIVLAIIVNGRLWMRAIWAQAWPAPMTRAQYLDYLHDRDVHAVSGTELGPIDASQPGATPGDKFWLVHDGQTETIHGPYDELDDALADASTLFRFLDRSYRP